MNIKHIFMLLIIGSSLSFYPLAQAAEDKHDGHEHNEESADHDKNQTTAHKDEHADHAADHGDDQEAQQAHDDHGDEHADNHKDEDHKEHGDEHQSEKHQDHAEEHGGHGGHGGHDEHGEEGVVKLTQTQMQTAGIIVKPLQLQLINTAIKAPGEVRFNAYKTAAITPRISAQVTGRHVVLGETVHKGQPVLTMSSVEMAEAQGELLVADREWKRVKKLGRKVVSARRYTEAKIKFELARARVRAYGMTPKQIESLIASEDFSRANGRFALVAPGNGTVLKENYILGQQAEPGQELIRITDESSLWVIANVPPSISHEIQLGNPASVSFNKQIYPAKVAQINHSLDEITRTTGIRLLVENKDDALHPGLFVNTQIETSSHSKALALPEAAVLRSPDGDWQVLVEQDEPGEFKGVEINLLRVSDGKAIIDGIEPGTRVVVDGAFFVQSELAKGGFEIHNH